MRLSHVGQEAVGWELLLSLGLGTKLNPTQSEVYAPNFDSRDRVWDGKVLEIQVRPIEWDGFH